MLVSDEELKELEKLSFPFSKFHLSSAGEGYTTFGKGKNPEFMEYKPYSPGYDVSDIDWKLYMRTEKMFVKEREGTVRKDSLVFVDCSDSMTEEKLLWALKSAVLMCFVLSLDRNAFRVFTFSNDVYPVGSFYEKESWIELDEVFSARKFRSGGRSDWKKVLASVYEMKGGKAVFFITDGIGVETESDLLAEVSMSFDEFVFVRVNSEIEKSFNIDGTFAFLDPETGRKFIVDARDVKEKYLENFRRSEELIAGSVNGLFLSFSTESFPVVAVKNVVDSFWKFASL